MATYDNSVTARGSGRWTFRLYNPAGELFGPFKGDLEISKDWHSVIAKDASGKPICLFNAPSQNVSCVTNVIGGGTPREG